MNSTEKLALVLASFALGGIMGHEFRHGGPTFEHVAVTNYVTLPAEWGPDGYGFRHLAKEDAELVRDAIRRIDNPFQNASSQYFEDLSVTKTVTHDHMTANEIVQALSTLPNVATVSQFISPKMFTVGTLAFPQYESQYQLTKTQWKELQDYCRLQLIDPIAAPEVIQHWRKITNGIVPFGLKVSGSNP